MSLGSDHYTHVHLHIPDKNSTVFECQGSLILNEVTTPKLVLNILRDNKVLLFYTLPDNLIKVFFVNVIGTFCKARFELIVASDRLKMIINPVRPTVKVVILLVANDSDN